MNAADTSVTATQQIGTTVVLAGLYFVVGALAIKDIRASRLLAIAFAVVFTPVLAKHTKASTWSIRSRGSGSHPAEL
jgi:hypothetical protein